MRTAKLMIVGNIAQAIGALVAHHIDRAVSTVEDPHGFHTKGGQTGCLTKVVVDGDRYNHVITSWLNEDTPTVQPGTLLRAQWEQAAA
jgi:hypothetical protein